MSLGFPVIKKIGIIALFLLGSVGGCRGVVEERDLVSTVDDINVYEQYVVIHAGCDQGIKVGSKFTLSREYRVTSNVVVFEVADTTCKARAYKGDTITMVEAGDKARLYVPTMIEKPIFLWLCTVLIGLILAIKRRNGLIWLLGIIGLILQPMLMDIGGGSWIGWIGILFSIIGLSLYATAKGRHGAWGLFGLFPVVGILIGVIVIWCLKDCSSTTSKEHMSYFNN